MNVCSIRWKIPCTEVIPAKAQKVLITIRSEVIRPLAAGARTTMPQVTYQAHTIGPRRARTSSVMPRRLHRTVLRRAQELAPAHVDGDGESQHAEHRAHAHDVEMGVWTTWLAMDAARATTLTGVTPVKDASAVEVVRIQPQPVPEMMRDHLHGGQRDDTGQRGVRDAAAHGCARSGPHPTQEQHAERGGRLHPGRQCAQDDAGHGADAFGHGQSGHEEADHQRVVVGAAEQGQQDQW